VLSDRNKDFSFVMNKIFYVRWSTTRRCAPVTEAKGPPFYWVDAS